MPADISIERNIAKNSAPGNRYRTVSFSVFIVFVNFGLLPAVRLLPETYKKNIIEP